MWALQQTSLPRRLAFSHSRESRGHWVHRELTNFPLGPPAIRHPTGLGTSLTFNHFIHSVKPTSEIAKSRLKKYRTRTASKWQSSPLTLFLPDCETSPADHAVFHTPDSDSDTPGYQGLQVTWGLALWRLLEVVQGHCGELQMQGSGAWALC